MTTPTLLCLSGLDPCGGAGLQADIEAAGLQGVHVLGVATVSTVQDTGDVHATSAIDADWLARQLDTVLSDCRPDAVKIGLLGSATQIDVLVPRLVTLGVPIVCDPVLRAGGGASLADDALIARLLTSLLPHLTILTPNAAEVRRLAANAASPASRATTLLATGCASILVTGGDEPGDVVTDTLYRPNAAPRAWSAPRIPGRFHGAGCTLAASLAARLAMGDPLEDAVTAAREATRRALQQARSIGRGRAIPWRHPA